MKCLDVSCLMTLGKACHSGRASVKLGHSQCQTLWSCTLFMHIVGGGGERERMGGRERERERETVFGPSMHKCQVGIMAGVDS